MSNNFPYDMQLLWDTINDGLTFFQDEFGSLLSTPKGMKGFAVRPDDKTGSCYIKKSTKSGLYLFTDFGGNNITPDQKGVNAIDYVIKTRNVDYAGACKILFTQYNLPISEKEQAKPITEFSSNVTKKDGYFKVDYFSKIQDPNALKRIIPFYTDELLAEYDFKQIRKYERVGSSDKGLYHFTSTATTEFPIYGYDKEDFVKLYQPNAPRGDKYLQKHSFVGKKPERPIYGWDNLLSKLDVDAIHKLESKISYAAKRDKKDFIEQLQELKLDNCIIATGGSDGLNIASLGYPVIWFNSETEVISKSEYYELKRYVKNIYYCPDLDKTGITQAVKLGMKLTKIKMIWLPETLKEFNKKDAADWVRANKSLGLEVVKAMFAQILSQAIEFQFWKWNDKRGNYTLSVNQMLQFLKYNGFFQYKIETNGSDNTKKTEDKIFVQVQNNVAKQVFPSDIKEFVLNWLRTNFISLEIQEMIIKSVFFSERSGLTSLEVTELKTKTGTKDSQIYFFNQDAVVVTKDAIKVVKADSLNVKTWESNIIKRNFKLQDAPFRIFTNEKGNLDIEILNDASNYFKVLINTSRVFWQKDIDKQGNDTQKFKITSPNLTDEENQLQKLQLINKLFCIAHLLHKYKMKSKSYLILGIDRKIGESAKDNKGGSGKSFMIETVFNYVFNRNIIDGRNLHKDDSKFMLDGTTKETDIVYFEDLSPYFDFNTLFNFVTGEIKANHKGGKIFTIPFTDFAKTVVTMNAVPYDITDSLRRRLATFECCDYYHEIGEEYKETRTIRTDFGKDLFDENYTAAEWASEDNFMMYALQYYLNCDAKIELDGGNLMARNLVQKIGDPAMKFFTNFFSDPTNLSDRGHESKGLLWVYKKAVYDFYKDEVSQKAKSSQEFKDILDLYCKYKGWTIAFAKKKIDSTGNSVEHFNINMGSNVNELNTVSNTATAAIDEDEDEQTDLPF
ncbi:MAG: hypothetical protein EOP00_11630 [Pedobacter sp.]|nr:MAG: hypothetical protein EOP00_11630 [Pedobacter sp.]